ncbi:hypothetical protein ACWGCP_15395, partial [Streptomyces niveus]
MAVLDTERDPAGGASVDEPGDRAAEPGEDDVSVRVVRDRLVVSPVAGGEVVRPPGEVHDAVAGAACGQGVSLALLRVLRQVAGEQPLPFGQFLKYLHGLVDRLDDGPGVGAHFAPRDAVASPVGGPLEVQAGQGEPDHTVGVTGLDTAAAPQVQDFLGPHAGQVGDHDQGGGHEVEGEVFRLLVVDRPAPGPAVHPLPDGHRQRSSLAVGHTVQDLGVVAEEVPDLPGTHPQGGGDGLDVRPAPGRCRLAPPAEDLSALG